MNISVCICTYNRCDSLRLTLDSLHQRCDEFREGDEVLVVDNNSNDQTKEVALSFQHELPLTYFFEKAQGLSAARNKGLSTFKNSVIIFIDDDITIPKGFINAYRQAFLDHPECYFYGGRIEVDWGEKKPYWYKSKKLPMINGLIGNYDLGSENQQFKTTSLLPYGANFAIKRKLINVVGEFNLKLGVQGKKIGRGEESDYFNRALDKGLGGMYIADAMVYHRFQIQRISLLYLYRYGLQKGVASALIDNVEPQGTFKKVLYQCFAGIYQLMKLRVDRLFQCVINIGLLIGIHRTALSLKKDTDEN